MTMITSTNSPQVKICGITSPGDAVMCLRAGADALGVVFFPGSPRCVTAAQAAEIASALPPGFPLVGVFVDADDAEIFNTCERASLTAVQLHGGESPRLVADLRRRGLFVIKALFTGREPGVSGAGGYLPSAFLVEAGRDPLPGGTGRPWDWGVPGTFYRGTPLILAGGLTAVNVVDSVGTVRPDAVDVSSGVESAPGRKDPDRVQEFLAAVRACPGPLIPRRAF